METTQLQQALDNVFDHGVVFHAFTDYMRDYEVIVYVTADPRTGVQPAFVRYLFKFCVLAEARSTVDPEVWRRSLDPRLTDAHLGPDLDGYVWGVRWQVLYPGGQVITDSPRAREWTDRVGIDFHEVRVEMNGHLLTLVFSELEVTQLPMGYTPYTVADRS